MYAWADQHSPSGKQLCRVLAQLARALEAVHAEGAVHRDVKGDNVLVRLSDRLPVLIDFGSCHLAGAQRLTRQSLPPMTPEYFSPQVMLFFLRSQGQPDGYYPPSPADDLYALGVTAYRLVMGQYPACLDARKDEHGTWQGTSPDFRPLLESNPRLEPPLREVILQLLSHAPEQRGTAAQVAQALEAAAGEEERPERSRLAWASTGLEAMADAGGSGGVRGVPLELAVGASGFQCPGPALGHRGSRGHLTHRASDRHSTFPEQNEPIAQQPPSPASSRAGPAR